MCICLFQFWKTILLWGRMFVFQKRAAAKALAVSSKHQEAFASQSVLSFSIIYILNNNTVLHV